MQFLRWKRDVELLIYLGLTIFRKHSISMILNLIRQDNIWFWWKRNCMLREINRWIKDLHSHLFPGIYISYEVIQHHLSIFFNKLRSYKILARCTNHSRLLAIHKLLNSRSHEKAYGTNKNLQTIATNTLLDSNNAWPSISPQHISRPVLNMREFKTIICRKTYSNLNRSSWNRLIYKWITATQKDRYRRLQLQ